MIVVRKCGCVGKKDEGMQIEKRMLREKEGCGRKESERDYKGRGKGSGEFN